MTTPSLRDVEQLSAFLDGQLSQADKARLESRIETDLELAAVLEDLRSARAILRQTPRRRVPRNFTLTPRMVGIRPPVPRLVPALSWASALAMLLFVFTLGGGLLGQLSLKAAAPMMGAAPSDMNVSRGYGVGGGLSATQMPQTESSLQVTPTPEISKFQAPPATTLPVERTVQPPSVSTTSTRPVNPWYFIWPGLAVVLFGTASSIRWAGVKKFRNKTKTQK